MVVIVGFNYEFDAYLGIDSIGNIRFGLNEHRTMKCRANIDSGDELHLSGYLKCGSLYNFIETFSQ